MVLLDCQLKLGISNFWSSTCVIVSKFILIYNFKNCKWEWMLEIKNNKEIFWRKIGPYEFAYLFSFDICFYDDSIACLQDDYYIII